MQNKLKILADENIPSLGRLLPESMEVDYLPGRDIGPEQLQAIDGLLVRSVTQVNKALLANSPVKFVGSCTIGTDHVDLHYLSENNIAFGNAPGCNADAVVDYVLSAMLYFEHNLLAWQKKTVGIIGFGQVGSRLYRRLSDLGIPTKCYDPFVNNAVDDLDSVLSADCITCHVPLTTGGEHPTFHMLSTAQLAKIKHTSLLINTSRGAVIDNFALKNKLKTSQQAVVLDVYENEPLLDVELLPLLLLATPHIAGYSHQGKIRGSIQVSSALLKYFNLPAIDVNVLNETEKVLEYSKGVKAIINRVFPIQQQSHDFIEWFLACSNDAARVEYFDGTRKQYPLRSEWQYSRIQGNIPTQEATQLSALSFLLP